MDPLPPIPTPAAQRWREFRIQVLPFIVFFCVVVTIAFLWRNFLQPVGVVGEVEAIRANVITTQEGLLAELTVDRFETVAKGQPIGQILTVDPELHEASLNKIAADLKLMQSRMELDKRRNQDAYTRLKLDLLTEKVALNLAQVRLTQAESEFQRMTKLFSVNLVPAGVPQGPPRQGGVITGYEEAKRDRDALQMEIADRTKLIAQWEQDLKEYEAAGLGVISLVDPAIEEDIKAQQEHLRLLEKPTILKAPIDGVVSTVLKRPGEKLARGEIIVTIAAPDSNRIIGYLRQPIGTMPTTNDTVIVRTRAQRRQVGNAQILKIGAQMELINPLLLSPDATRQEVGLPILISLPPNLRLIPGEYVDLAIQFARRD